MNWSSKWPDPIPLSNVKWIDSAEAEKIESDARLFGVGYSVDGKYIPAEDVIGKYITINYNDGNIIRKVLVEVVGDLGLEFDDGNGWCIYHLPTYSRFDKAVPPVEPDVTITRVEPLSGEFQGSNVKWISKEEAEKQFPSNRNIIESFEYDKPELLRWMAKVQTNFPTAWTMLRCLTPQDYESKGQSAKDIILEWCLSVKVE